MVCAGSEYWLNIVSHWYNQREILVQYIFANLPISIANIWPILSGVTLQCWPNVMNKIGPVLVTSIDVIFCATWDTGNTKVHSVDV